MLLTGRTKLQQEALPHLQSLVIVLLKAILMNVAVLMAQAPAGQQQHPAAGGPNNRGFPNQQQGNQGNTEPIDLTPEEIDAARTREISAKAVSGILLLLLKWLKVSRTSLLPPLMIYFVRSLLI